MARTTPAETKTALAGDARNLLNGIHGCGVTSQRRWDSVSIVEIRRGCENGVTWRLWKIMSAVEAIPASDDRTLTLILCRHPCALTLPLVGIIREKHPPHQPLFVVPGNFLLSNPPRPVHRLIYLIETPAHPPPVSHLQD